MLQDLPQGHQASFSSSGHSPSPEVDSAPRTEDREETSMDTSEGKGNLLCPQELYHNLVLANEECEKECLKEILHQTQNVKYKRSFGLLLKIEPGDLDQFEQGPESMVSQIVRKWFKMPMTISNRWKELIRVLRTPAVKELKLANDLQTLLCRKSSNDSAISEMSDFSRCSVPSSPDVFSTTETGI